MSNKFLFDNIASWFTLKIVIEIVRCMFNYSEGVILMENMKKIVLAAVVGLVIGQTVVAHEGCQAPVDAAQVNEETVNTVVQEESVDTAVTDGNITEDTVVAEDTVVTEEVADEDSEAEDMLNKLEAEQPAK